MHLFDNEINEVYQLLTEKIELPITKNLLEDVGSNNMIFKDECAFELGEHKSLSFDLSSSDINIDDRIYLIGNNLNNIKTNEDFMRITLLHVKEESLQGNALYNRLEQIKLAKYKVSPKGYMLRTSTGNKEKIRVSKELAQHASFSSIGSAYIQAYKKLTYVDHVTVFFIVGTSDLYEPLLKIANKKAEITDTIDHILKGFMVNDCNVCSAKDLCEEVQELREIHQSL